MKILKIGIDEALLGKKFYVVVNIHIIVNLKNLYVIIPNYCDEPDALIMSTQA
jgi:hypothetical protein